MSYLRAMMRHDILGRGKNAAVDFAAPADFTLGPPARVDALRPEDGAVIYCFDVATERAWFTLCDDVDAMLGAPFLYAAQFAHARQIVTVPFEMLADIVPVGAAAPTLVFSIGRCGSTLLFAMLRDVGVRAVSEPDVMSQLAQLLIMPPHGLGPDFVGTVTRACFGSLRVHGGDRFVVKLRSQCNHVAAGIARAHAAVRCVFMLRADRHAWARSRHLAFRETPEDLARMLAWGIYTYDALSRTGCDLTLLWYEDVRDAPARALRAAGFGVDDGQAAALGASLARDSQTGTGLSRDTLGVPDMTGAELVAFDRAWASHRPAALIEAHGLQRLA